MQQNVIITETKYLELIDHTKNQNKFYRMTKLNNGKWLQQNGRIGTEGAKRLYDNSTYDKNFLEKLDKGYKGVHDHYFHHIDGALQYFGFTAISMVDSDDEIIAIINASPGSPDDEEKIRDILERIDTLKNLIRKHDPLDISVELSTVENIRNQISKHHIFTPTDIKKMNELCNKYESKEEELV